MLSLGFFMKFLVSVQKILRIFFLTKLQNGKTVQILLSVSFYFLFSGKSISFSKEKIPKIIQQF